MLNCPSCAGQIEADQKYCHLVICPYCSSSLVLDEKAAKIVGKMSTLPAPPGLLFVGATGTWNKRGFEIIGRVRYGWEQGCWDEWYVMFNDGTPRWISEDEGHLTLETCKQVESAPKNFDDLRAGHWIKLGKKRFHIDEKNIATCEGGEGQLPFMIEQGEKVRYIELTGDEEHGTIEFEAGGGCKIFVGATISYKDLKLDRTAAEAGVASAGSIEQAAGDGSRERIVKTGERSLQLNCPACGSSLGIPEEGIDAMACPACSTTIDLAAEQVACPQCGGGVQLHGEAKMAVCNHCDHQMTISGGRAKLLEGVLGKDRPKFPVKCGQRCTFDGIDYHLVGILRYDQKEGGVHYYTDEFLLYNNVKGYRWLGLYQGHWNLARKLTSRPPGLKPSHAMRRQKFHYMEKNWRVYEKARWKTCWVEGELPWVCKLGDESRYMDAVAPPLMISAEWTEQEVEWSMAKYVTADEVAAAFKIPRTKLPRTVGIGACQPFSTTPFRRQAAWAMLIFAMLQLVLAIGSCTSSGKLIKQLHVAPTQYAQEHITEPFEITSKNALCAIKMHAPVSNNWVYLDMALIDDKDLALIDFSGEMSYYHGSSGGESWSEGSQNDSKMLKLKKPGKYRLLMKGQGGHTVNIKIYQDATLSRYYILLFIFGLCWAGWEWCRKGMFEATRWGEEDD